MKVIRAAVDEMWSILGQMTSAVFRHGLPLTDKIAARTALTNFVLHIHPVRVRRSWIRMSYTLCLGGLSFFLFIVLTVTGLYLMFYYVPSTQHAYQDMRDLQFVVTFGGLIRNMHRWAAHAMVITVWLHMARVFLTGAYKKPREFNWGVGTLLLLITLLLSFTGYLLPWDQLSIWAVTVGTNMAKYAPIAGPYTRYLLIGGRVVGDNALVRFYLLHVGGLPLAAFRFFVPGLGLVAGTIVRPGQPGHDAESLQGALVLSRPAGTALALPAADGGRRLSDVRDRAHDSGAVPRSQPQPAAVRTESRHHPL